MGKGNLKTKLLSVLLVVAMVITSITVWPVKKEVKAATDYLEWTFSDFGLEDGAYGVGNMKRNTSLTSLDGVAITGDLVLTDDGDHKGLQLEAGNGGWTTFQIYRVGTTIYLRHWGATGMPEVNFDASELGMEATDFSATKIRTRVCFDKVSNTSMTATMTMTVGDKSVTKTLTMEGVADMVYSANGYRIGPAESASSVGFYSVKPEKKIYTFSDFGITEGNYAGSYAHGNLPEGVTSWNNVTLVGEIIMPKNNDGPYIGIAGTENTASGIKLFGANGNQLWFWNDLTSKNHLGITEGQQDANGNVLGTVQGEKIKVQFDFTLEGDDVQMRFTVNDTWVYDWTFKETASALGNRLVISGDVSVYDVKNEEEPGEQEPRTLTFNELGITDGNYTGTYIHGELPSDIATWHNVTVEGYVTMPSNDSGAYIGWLGTEQCPSGLKYFANTSEQTWFWNDLNGNANADSVSVDKGKTDANGNVLGNVTGESVKMSVTFKYVGNDLNMILVINDAWTLDWTFRNLVNILGRKVVVSGNVTVSAEADKPAEQEPRTLTFGDLGITDGNYAGTYVHGELPSDIATWHNVTVEGYVTMPSNDSGAYIGWLGTEQCPSGLKYFANTSEQTWFWNDLNANANADSVSVDKGKNDANGNVLGNVTGENIKMSVTFKYVDNDLNMILVINDTWTLDWTFRNLVDVVGRKVVVSGNVTIGEEAVYEEPEYTELTFEDLGIRDANYNGGHATGTLPEGITSFDEVAITGIVTLPADSDSPYIGFAGTENMPSGIKMFGAYGNSLWMWNDLTGKNHLGVNEGDLDADSNVLGKLLGEPLKIWVGFDFVDNDVYVKLVLGEAWTHRWIIEDSADAFGTNVTVSGDVTIGEPKVYEYTEVSFDDFGIAGQQLSGETVVSSKTPAESMNLLKFVGYITFPDGRDNGHISIAGKDGNNGIAVFWQSDNIWFWDETGANLGCIDAFHPEDLGYESFAGKELKVAIAFAYEGTDAFITMTLDDQVEKSKLLTGYTEWLGTEVKCVAGSNGTITYRSSLSETIKKPVVNDTPLRDISKYETVTFIEMGLDDETVKGFGREDKSKIDTLDGKVFQGFVTFPADGQGIIRVGGTVENRWYGIHVEASNGGLRLFEAANGKQQWKIGSDVIGKDITDKKIKLALTFTKVDDHNVYVGIYVDDKFCGEKLFENLEQPFGAGLLVYSEEVGITIASVETAWQRFLKSVVNLAYFGFTDNWKQELADICR